MTTDNTAPAEKPLKPLTLSYHEATEYLSRLEFETTALVDGEVPPSVNIAVSAVAAIYQKLYSTVLDDLIEQRLQEAEDVRINNELMYGHIGQYD